MISDQYKIGVFELPNSSGGTNFDAIDRIAMNDVPFRISTIAPGIF